MAFCSSGCGCCSSQRLERSPGQTDARGGSADRLLADARSSIPRCRFSDLVRVQRKAAIIAWVGDFKLRRHRAVACLKENRAWVVSYELDGISDQGVRRLRGRVRAEAR